MFRFCLLWSLRGRFRNTDQQFTMTLSIFL